MPNERARPSAPRRARRADARENRNRILLAAQRHFEAHGEGAEMDAIAREAGVAVGTIYNHFGSKEELLNAVVQNGLSRFEALLRSWLDEPDPWTGVERLFTVLAEEQVRARALPALIGGRPELRASADAAKRALGPLIGQLLARAQAAGKVRADVTVSDVPLLLAGLSQNVVDPAVRKRYLEIVLQGLRPLAGSD